MKNGELLQGVQAQPGRSDADVAIAESAMGDPCSFQGPFCCSHDAKLRLPVLAGRLLCEGGKEASSIVCSTANRDIWLFAEKPQL